VQESKSNLRDNEGNLPSDLATDPQVLTSLTGKKTSVSHPYTIDFIDRTLCPMLQDARIGMCMCPGREWHEWSRDFDADLKCIVDNKVNVVASIITRTELTKMNHPDFYEKIKKHGLESIEYSIHDKWLPNSIDNFMKVVVKIVEYLRNKKTVLVHCNGGRGRTGLIVAACIILIGYNSDKAIQFVRTARTGMLRNPAQELFLHTLESKLQSEDDRVPEEPIYVGPSTPTKKTKLFDFIRRPSHNRDLHSSSDGSPPVVRAKGSKSENSSPGSRHKTRSDLSTTTSLPRRFSAKVKVSSGFHTIDIPPSQNPDVFSVMERGDVDLAAYEMSPALLRSGDH